MITCPPYNKKWPRGRPVRWWSDEADEYWTDTIGQRTAHDRQILKQPAEAFAQPRDIMAAPLMFYKLKTDKSVHKDLERFFCEGLK